MATPNVLTKEHADFLLCWFSKYLAVYPMLANDFEEIREGMKLIDLALMVARKLPDSELGFNSSILSLLIAYSEYIYGVESPRFKSYFYSEYLVGRGGVIALDPENDFSLTVRSLISEIDGEEVLKSFHLWLMSGGPHSLRSTSLEVDDDEDCFYRAGSGLNGSMTRSQ